MIGLSILPRTGRKADVSPHVFSFSEQYEQHALTTSLFNLDFYLSESSIQGAKDDLSDLRTYINKAKKRSTVPPWSVPLELWWMFFVSEHARAHSTTLGVGACRDRVCNPTFFACFSSFSPVYVTLNGLHFCGTELQRLSSPKRLSKPIHVRIHVLFLCSILFPKVVFVFTLRVDTHARRRMHTPI